MARSFKVIWCKRFNAVCSNTPTLDTDVIFGHVRHVWWSCCCCYVFSTLSSNRQMKVKRKIRDALPYVVSHRN